MSLGNGRYLFDVTASVLVLEQIKGVQRQAEAAGVANHFEAAVRGIYANLRYFAREFGEPLRDLPAAGLQVRIGVMGPVCVRYGVHRLRAVVFVRDFVLLSSKR